MGACLIGAGAAAADMGTRRSVGPVVEGADRFSNKRITFATLPDQSIECSSEKEVSTQDRRVDTKASYLSEIIS